MAGKQPPPEIRTEAFIAAREKCALTVEELAQLACLSKKQIQQIENGGREAFYSSVIKFTAARKVAKLIQLDEKEAFDFGPQAELPFAAVAPAELGTSEINNAQENALPKAVPVLPKVNQVDTATPEKKGTAPLARTPINQSRMKQARSTPRYQKSPSKKWFWLLPVGALAVALVQLQPLLEDQLDALMGKSKPAEALAPPSAPAAEIAPSNPSATEASAIPAPAAPASPVAPSSPSPAVALTSGCPPADGEIASFKPPSAGKPGNVVFIRTNSAQSLCVVDADGVVQSKAMEPGIGHSFYGKPPFKLLSSNELSSAEIFFQGFRMRPSTPDMKAMLLVQADQQ
jgi:cytoskeleton protein RodZ